MDYQVSQTGSLWRRGRAFTGSDTRNMPIHGYRYFERHVSKDHVHLFVSLPPQISVSKLVGRIKGKTSRKLLAENRRLSGQFWDRHLWGRGYFAASSGKVDDVIMQYIAEQDLEERAHDDDFTLAP